MRSKVGRRYACRFLIGAGTSVLTTAWVRTSGVHAATRIFDRLEEARYGTFHSAAMGQLLQNAGGAHTKDGFYASSIETANLAMSNRFPDASKAEVYSGGCSALFFRYTDTRDNACGAWLNKCFDNDGCCDGLMAKLADSQIVTFIEGPMNVAVHSMLEDFGDHLVKYRDFSEFDAKIRAREIIAPLNADQGFTGSFYSVGGGDEYKSEHASVRIDYASNNTGGEARYAVRDKYSGELIYENSTSFPLI